MKRADRLMAILIALQQRQETTVSLAEKFEVSKRTILRDMQLLSEMGIPLCAMTGPTGGYRLMEGFQLPPLQLNSLEALSVLFALQSLTRLSDTPFNRERWTVTDKIKHILPVALLKQIEPMLAKVEMEVPKRSYKTPYLSQLLEHVSASQWLQIFYRSANHQRWLQILPQRVYTAYGFWYCEAYSLSHREVRLFRVDRIGEMKVIAPPELPFDGSHSANDRSSIHIKAKLKYRGMLQVERDPHIGELVQPVGDEEWEIDFECPANDWNWAIRLFYSLGTDALVIEPESLRNEIFRLAKQVSGQYEALGESS